MEEMVFQNDPNCEDRTLYLLSDSQIDQDFSKKKLLKESGSVRYQKPILLRGHLSNKNIEKAILQLKEQRSREDALDRLSQYLIERKEEELITYARIGYWLHKSFGTVVILLQEVMAFSMNLVKGKVDDRSYKRIANVLTLFQSVAANSETARKDLVISLCILLSEITNAVSTLTLYDLGVQHFQAVDRVRAYALSVIGVLCQTCLLMARESQFIERDIEGDMIEMCRVCIEVDSELCKVIGIHILETILKDQAGLSYICSPQSDNYKLLLKLMKTLGHMVVVLARKQDDSPRLLYHIIRCYILLCNDDMRGLRIVKKSLPHHFTYEFFRETTEEHPTIRESLDQLLLAVGVH